MSKTTKRIFLAALLALLLTVDAWISYSCALRRACRARAAVSGAIAREEADPLTRFRTEREQLRASQTAQLNDIIYAEGVDGETALQARRRLMDALKYSEQELTLERILQARGFEEALVAVSADSVNVLVRAGSITQQESAVILDLVMRQTGVTGGNVKIIPVK